MVESFVDGDGSANYGVGYGPPGTTAICRGSSTASTTSRASTSTPSGSRRCLTPAPARPGTTGWMPPVTSPATSSTWIPTSAATPSLKTGGRGAPARALCLPRRGVRPRQQGGVSKPSPEGGCLPSRAAAQATQVSWWITASPRVWPTSRRWPVTGSSSTASTAGASIRLISWGWMTGAPFAARWRGPARRARPPASSGAPSATWWGSVEGRRRDPRQAYGRATTRRSLRRSTSPALRSGTGAGGGRVRQRRAGASVLDASWNKVENYPDHAMPNLMLGNHDLVRFGDLLEQGNFNGADYWQRHKAAFSFMAARPVPLPSTMARSLATRCLALPVRWGRLCGPGALR